MGATVSQSIDASVSESLSVVNNQTQNCVQQGSQSAITSVCIPEGCRNVDIEISGISYDQVAIYNTSCTEAISITTDIQQEISQDFAQKAEAVAQQFQASQADVDEAVKVAGTIGTTITTNTVQNCTQRVAQDAGINITCQGASGNSSQPSDNCIVRITDININQGFKPYSDCLLKDTQTQAVVNQVKQIISQSGTAKVESILGPLITIIILIIVFIGFLLVGGFKALTNWRLWLVVIIIVGIYLGLAYWRSWFPFE